jgi:hypothetical protein
MQQDFLVILSLDTPGKEKDELKNLNSQLELHINDPKASICAFKKILTAYSHGTEMTENQMQNLILQLAKL